MLHLNITDERLLTREGTIIPMAVRFPGGATLLIYHTGFDAIFQPCGMSRSDDKAATWQRINFPLRRVGACGRIGDHDAIFLDDCLVHAGGDEYIALTSRTTDGGRTFEDVVEARFTISNLIPKPYEPDPASVFAPPMPDWYRDRLPDNPQFAAHIFGRVIRLSDGALAMVCYGAQRGNLPKRRKQGAPASDGVADDANAGESYSAILVRSDDDGRTWREVSICGKLEPGLPFDGGYFFSNGFNETALIETAPNELLVMMRHGTFALMYTNRSTDGGRTWEGIRAMSHVSVAPRMVKLDNGILAAAWGRPGITVAFSLDGTGCKWDVMSEVLTLGEPSQYYPWLEPLDNDTVTLLYDRRTWDKPHPRYVDHGIYARDITIRSA